MDRFPYSKPIIRIPDKELTDTISRDIVIDPVTLNGSTRYTFPIQMTREVEVPNWKECLIKY